jgi:Coenzyme PQQ synthesis protein D (PqqD)
MSECYLPAARTTKLVVRELADEVLVYDTEAHRAHCLNRTAALVWKSCDGETPVSRITEMVGRQLSSPMTEDVVWLALEQLAEFELLSPAARRIAPPSHISRRRMLRRLGAAAAVSLPLVTSIVSPTAAHAQSSIPCDENTPCPEGQTCIGGLCE